MGGVKSNIAIYTYRVDVVMEMLLAGLRRKVILENIATNEKLKWNVSKGQIDNYIAKAKLEILTIMEPDKETLRKTTLARIEFLYAKFVNVKDYKGALLALKDISLLSGIAEASKIEITGKDGSKLFKIGYGGRKEE